ncbi:MAG TPA: hypothetical protein VEW67_04100 [Thermoleophilaceae bacterium]|nr:hypothetical protein [Thermoleophilaceae bacterium]
MTDVVTYRERPDGEPMTRDQLAERVEWWRSRVVPEWRVALNDDPPPDHDMDNVAGVMQSDWTIAELKIHFPDDTLELIDIKLDCIIVHELLHGALDRVLDHDEILRPHVAASLWIAYQGGRNGDMEEFNDRMARIIVNAVHGTSGAFCTRWADAGDAPLENGVEHSAG